MSESGRQASGSVGSLATRKSRQTRALSAAVAAGRIWLLAALLVLAGATGAQARVEGFGASTRGCGDDCTEYVVTNLNDSGAGSLREAVSAGNRRVVFSSLLADLLLAGGEIVLTDPMGRARTERGYDPNIYVRGANITIDGSTAPPPGITLRGGGLIIRGNLGAHDVIVRGLRIRDLPEDGIQITNGAHNIAISNVSVWAGPSQTSGDGLIDITEGAHNVTVAWSILGGSGKAMLIKYNASNVTLHNNIWVSARNRNPQVSVDEAGTDATDDTTTLDMRNNLVYDWIGGAGTTIHHGANANVVANFYSSPNDPTSDQEQAIIVCRGGGCFDGDPNNGARAFTRDNVSGDFLVFDINSVGTETVPFLAPLVTTDDACTAARLTLEGAGARPLDAIDLQFLTPITLPICRRTTTMLTATGSTTTTLGAPVTFSATVQARPPAMGTPGGSVTFLRGTVAMETVDLEGGVATMVTSALPQGSITVNAIYSGEPNFDVSQGHVKLKVIGAPTSTTLTALPNSSRPGVPVELTATVDALPPSTATPEGSVRFYDGTTLLGTKPLAGGVATLVTSTLPAGFRTMKAQFLGASGFAASSSTTLTLQIDGGTATALTRTPSSAYTGQPVTFTAKVTSLTGGSVQAGTVTFRDGAAVLDEVDLDDTGTAVLRTSSLPVGKHLVTASYNRTSSFEPSVSPTMATNVAVGGTRTTATSTVLTLARGQEVTFRVVVTPVAPAAGTPGGSVRFRDGSTTLATRNLSGGVAQFSTSALGVGSHLISVAYDGSAQFKTSASPKMTVTVTAP